MDDLEDVRAAAVKLDALRERIAGQVAYRDDLLRRAHAAGVRWTDLRDAAGLSPAGLSKVLRG